MNLSESLQSLLQQAQILATQKRHSQLDNIHVLSVIPKTDPELFENLARAGVAQFRFEKWCSNQLEQQPVQNGPIQEPTPSRALSFALTHAQSQKPDAPIDGLTYLHSLFTTQDAILKALEKIGLDLSQLQPQTASSEEQIPPYFINFTQKAQQGDLDPVIGREDEIERVMQILSRRTKNNPILIGEPGVGKTAIVEGLAQSIEQKLAPEPLWNKTVLGLDMTALIAGAKYRGEFEERLKKVMDYLEAHQDEFLIFIDEIHMLVGAGKTDGAMDAANILKPALARGSLHCIGATTLDEYRTGIEKDPALERRFQKVFVQEPSEEQTLSILRGIKERYEQHHNIKISDAALSAAVELSVRYINDRFLPDKAIDLIDEASSKIKLELVSKPQQLREIETKLHHLQMELIGAQEDRTKNADRIDFLQQQIEQLTKEQKQQLSVWEHQKSSTQKRSELETQIAQLKLQMEQALRAADYEKASQLQYAKIPELQKQLSDLSQSNPQDSTSLVEPIHIIQCVSKATGIPVQNIHTTDHSTLANLEQLISQRIQGQERIIKNVANTLRRAHFGISDPARPKASFLFVGPTGVGKTFLAKTLAQLLFASEKNLLRFDMSEFMDKHSVSKLIGAPPGYVGYEQAGQLTEAVRRRPYQVILFDEIEKAHPDVLNILLQLLDDGILTDGQGRTVNFKNSIIIMTTNLCAQTILEHQHQDAFLIEQIVQTELQKHLRPEFFNRIDSIETFTALGEETLGKIIQAQLDQLSERLGKTHLQVSFDPSVLSLIESSITNPHLGARPIKRALQQIIENPLAHALSKGTVLSTQPIFITQTLGKIRITNTN